MVTRMSPQNDAIDFYLSDNNYEINITGEREYSVDLRACNKTVVYDFYGKSIYNKKYVKGEFPIGVGVYCLATVYNIITPSSNNQINLGAWCKLTKEKDFVMTHGCGIGVSAKLSKTVLPTISAGIGVSHSVRPQVGADIDITSAKAGIGLGNKCKVSVYEEAYLSDYRNKSLSDLYAKGTLKEVYLKEKQ